MSEIEILSNFYKKDSVGLHYYEIKNDLQPLVLIHAQGMDGRGFENVYKKLSKKYHIYSVDCYGHGKSLHDPLKYNLTDISNSIIDFITDVIHDKFFILGHSSGGLIAACVASQMASCKCLILEDPPLFSCVGERRKNTYNYIDLSTVCHKFLAQSEERDFVLYYFENQYMWNFFPEKSRDKIKKKMVEEAKRSRNRSPESDLSVKLMPKGSMCAYKGMNDYDPNFGEAFYSDSFNAGADHERILKKIRCRTIFMKAKTDLGEDGTLYAALSEEDLDRVCGAIKNIEVVRFNCGHGIHIEKERQFVKCLIDIVNKK